MRAHRSQPYTAACAAAGEKESGDGRARAEHEGGRGVVPVVRRTKPVNSNSPANLANTASSRFCVPMFRGAYVAVLFLACCGTCCCMRLTPIVPLSRRSCLSAAALAAIPLAASAADSAQTLALLKEARAQLDACDGLIAAGSWDMVRTVVKTPPLVNAKNLITTYIKVCVIRHSWLTGWLAGSSAD